MITGQRSPRWAFMQRMTIPCENGLNYLTRLRVIQTPWFGVYLHDLYEPDSDRDPHDHPWDFTSFIVKGGYLEKVWPIPHILMDVSYKRRWNKYSWHKMTRDMAHRITSVDPGTRSLIFVGKRTRNWGFFTEDGWMSWQDYEKAKGLA